MKKVKNAFPLEDLVLPRKILHLLETNSSLIMKSERYNPNMELTITIFREVFSHWDTSTMYNTETCSEFEGTIKLLNFIAKFWIEFFGKGLASEDNEFYVSLSILLSFILSKLDASEKTPAILHMMLQATQIIQLYWNRESMKFFPEVVSSLGILSQNINHVNLELFYNVLLASVNHFQFNPNFDIIFQEVLNCREKIRVVMFEKFEEKIEQLFGRITENSENAAKNKPGSILNKVENLVKIKQKEPKIFDKKSNTEFQKKFEVQKLRKKIRKLKTKTLKEIKSDLMEGDREKHRIQNKQSELRKQSLKKAMRFLDEQQKEIKNQGSHQYIHKRRAKQHSRRLAGNKM